jgi:hypothetical protein
VYGVVYFIGDIALVILCTVIFNGLSKIMLS